MIKFAKKKMIQSMTGYGRIDLNIENKKISIEIKSLNSKSLDVNTRINQIFLDKDLLIRKKISEKLYRGKIDFSLCVEKDYSQLTRSINEEVVFKYFEQINLLSTRLNVKYDSNSVLFHLLSLPESITTSCISEITDDNWSIVEKGIDQVIQNLVDFRKQEGVIIYNFLKQKIGNIRSKLNEIKEFENDRVKKIKEKLWSKILELNIPNVDTNRFEQELIYYIEKIDISEEKLRLTNHLDYFLVTLDSIEETKGKKLGFIAQEIGREINTMGSKSNDSNMQKMVVQMKDELEQIKEQILNVL